MMLGNHEAKITRTEFETVGRNQTPCLKVYVTIDGEETYAPIWLTKKNVKNAEVELELCGFDVESQALESLASGAASPLVGNAVNIEVYEDEWQGQIVQKAQIARRALRVSEIGDLQKKLFGKRSRETAAVEDDIPF